MLPCLVGLFWPSFGQMIKNKEEFVSTRPVGFAAGKKGLLDQEIRVAWYAMGDTS